MPAQSKNYPNTPDGRYFIVKGRLWRSSNPSLTEEQRAAFVKDLMDARREIKNTKDKPKAQRKARDKVQTAKEALGERGEVWWSDGAPDMNRKMVKNTPYQKWYESLEDK